jgi:hypothetical protein
MEKARLPLCRLLRPSWTATTHPQDSPAAELLAPLRRPASSEWRVIRPIQQAISVYHFACMVRACRLEWTIGMFTGYSLGELMNGRKV